jgi:hypothetical protein
MAVASYAGKHVFGDFRSCARRAAILRVRAVLCIRPVRRWPEPL